MTRQGVLRRRLGRTVGAIVLSLALGSTAAFGQAQPPSDTGDLPVNPEWLSNTLTRASTTTSVQNNLIDGAIANRDRALAEYKAARARARKGKGKGKAPSPLSKPEYLVVWSAKQNAGDVYGHEIGDLLSNATVNPQGLLDLLEPQFTPGLDGFQVIDERKLNVDGSQNADYGK